MQNTQKYKFYFSTESIKTLKSKKIKFLLIQYIPAIAVCIYLYFNTDLKTVLFLGILGLITALVFWYYHFSNLLEKIELIITENNLTISGSKRFKLDVNIIIDKNTKISKNRINHFNVWSSRKLKKSIPTVKGIYV